MNPLLFLLIPLVVLFLLALLARLQEKKLSELVTYSKHPYLCSKAEYSFYRVLVKAVGDDYVVCPKVRVSDVLRPESGLKGKKWWRAFNKISRKHFDYVICSSASLAIVAAVELDDSSHQTVNAMKSDAIKDYVAESACVPLIRIRVARTYQVNDIHRHIFAAKSHLRTTSDA
ncbi:DUF2726 domain-containing protein [Enterovibrio norvegicus]|uniref:DUF2726 domain-containing protein n=1 Tax=Enterovibrio norvegicus TaxID=188144 RepID=UPI0024B173B6|nr:DUF2726 domain-containing protein [Enterovibrio norvegicus]